MLSSNGLSMCRTSSQRYGNHKQRKVSSRENRLIGSSVCRRQGQTRQNHQRRTTAGLTPPIVPITTVMRYLHEVETIHKPPIVGANVKPPHEDRSPVFMYVQGVKRSVCCSTAAHLNCVLLIPLSCEPCQHSQQQQQVLASLHDDNPAYTVGAL